MPKVKSKGKKARGKAQDQPAEEGAVAQETAPPESALEGQAAAMQEPVTIPPEELGIQMEMKLALHSNLPRRPDYGKMGRKIKLLANCFAVTAPGGYIYHYDVEISDSHQVVTATSVEKPKEVKSKEKKYRCLSTKLNRDIIKLMLKADKNFRGIFAAYDGQKNLYTKRPLGISRPLKVEVVMEVKDSNPEHPEEGQKKYSVVIKPVHKKDTNSCAISLDALTEFFHGTTRSPIPQEVVMALETVFRQTPCMRYIPIGRTFHYPPESGNAPPLGGGREIWFGYHQSLHIGQWRSFVNIDTTAKAFYTKGSVLNFVCKVLDKDLSKLHSLNPNETIKLSKELKGMKVQVIHLQYNRKYRVLGVTKETANQLQFPLTDERGKTTMKNVSDYFYERYKTKLKYPNLSCLQVGPETKKVYLPMEVCEIVEGQHCRRSLDEQQTAQMIRFNTKPPIQRFGEIQNIVRNADFNRDEILRAFDIQVSCEPVKLEGRIIEPPNVMYDRNMHFRPIDGMWDMRDKRFFEGADVKSWFLLSFANPHFCSMETLNNFVKLLIKIASETGIKIKAPSAIKQFNPQREKSSNILKQMQAHYKANLAIVVIPSTNKLIYGEIKQAAETLLCLNTQCVKDENVVKKCNPPLLSNICQKINAKMGGVNNTLTPGEKPEIFKKPVIIIGADVTHPGPSHEIKPSLAAAVGSLDDYPSRYAVTIRAQTNVDEKKQAIEIILDLKDMVRELLLAYYKKTRLKPEKIIFYRDGVSEGQFSEVQEKEVKFIRDACTSLSVNYQPGITFIVVQKRHHTRFIPQNLSDGRGKAKNIPPGTTVDTEVSHPLNFDFFLCSHFGLQGTSKPTHYTVLEDDNKFTSDQLQKLSFYLCHTYVRCTKSISIPAPVQYAHLAAFRARQHLLTQIGDTSSDSEISEQFHQLPENVIKAIKVQDVMKNTMYFV